MRKEVVLHNVRSAGWTSSLVCLSICGLLRTTVLAQPSSSLVLRSSDATLDESYAWAKDKALSLVRTGQRPDYIPCYFAAMSDTEFCVRDVAHMMEGAHLLGLDTENWVMMHAFAWGANRRVRQDHHWPRWHYPYTGKAADSLGSCQWRTLPAPFDMAWRCYEQYLWTGDERWVNDPEMFAYHENLHTKFMEHQNWDDDPVADELQQLASYFEFPKAGEHFVNAGDAIGCQYQALKAYAAILEHRGDSAAAKAYQEKALWLRAHFETCWFDEEAGRYIRGFDRFTGFKSDWGRENSYFMPMTLITDQGPRTADYLDFIDESITQEPLNIEASTYIPEVFYKHGRNEQAWKHLRRVMKTRSGYPEVSFTCVGNTIAGMMGVWPDAAQASVATLPQLPGEIEWVEADHVPVGGNDLLVRHDGNHQTTLRTNTGPVLTWEARFAGNFRQLSIDGVAHPATVTRLNGRTISSVSVRVASGRTVVVQTRGNSGPDLSPPPPPQRPESPKPPTPAPGSYYLSDMQWRYGTSKLDRAIRLDADRDDAPMKIGGVTYDKGISTHGVTAIRYDLHQQYSRLLCDVGFAPSADATGSVEFVVYGGTNVSSLLYTSGVLRAESGASMRHVNINVADCEFIVLGVKDAGDGDRGDVVHWGSARVIAKGGSSDSQPPTAPTDLRVTDATHSSVRLQWTAACDNVGVKGYDIYCGTINVGSTQMPAFQATGLDANTSYTFAVKVWDNDGNTSIASPAVKVTTPLAPELAYLSQLNWKSATTDFGSVSKDRSVNGKPIQLGGARYERGIGTHAASEIAYDLSKLGRTYSRFVSDVGVDDEVSENSTVVFQVFADEKEVFDSGVMRPESDTKQIDVSVTDVQVLKLVVTDAGDGINSDHADWAGARLVSRAK